ncbi:MAG: ABC transporter substrate-binding protein [Gemmatimonadales bacterium]
MIGSSSCRLALFWIPLLLVASCGRDRDCPDCGTVVVAAVGEPSAVLPPLSYETVGRDIGDLVYERLADLEPGRPTVDPAAYRPRLASSWDRVDSLTLRFHLRRGASWQDGVPVTAADVVFSFDAFQDSIIDALARPQLEANIASVDADDSLTVSVRFRRAYPEQIYDATYHVRVIPRHVWDSIPRARWAGDTAVTRLVGSGPFRVDRWERGRSLTLVRVPGEAAGGNIARVIWQFTEDPEAALNLMLSHEADLLETVQGQAAVDRAGADSALTLLPYPSAVYGFLAFEINGPGRPHPILRDRTVRRALVAALDRKEIARSVFGPETKVPPGPISQLLWIWSRDIRTIPFDTAAAAAALDTAGWRRGPDGMRFRNGTPLAMDILVPATSSLRRRAAEAIQEAWRQAGVRATVTSVDMPVFQQRLAQGRFDSYIGAYLDEPSPRGLADQWSRDGWDAINFGHYDSSVFDSLLHAASVASRPASAGRLWHEALDTLNMDAPAAWLFTPTNIALVSRRLEGVRINPYSWLSGLEGWKVREGEER